MIVMMAMIGMIVMSVMSTEFFCNDVHTVRSIAGFEKLLRYEEIGRRKEDNHLSF